MLGSKQMNRASKTLVLACLGLFVSMPAFAQAGGPDLPGKAKTTRAKGGSMHMKHTSIKMNHKGKMAGHKMM